MSIMAQHDDGAPSSSSPRICELGPRVRRHSSTVAEESDPGPRRQADRRRDRCSSRRRPLSSSSDSYVKRRRRRFRAAAAAAAAAFVLTAPFESAAAVDVDYDATPTLLWSVLPTSSSAVGPLGRGNAVALTHDDELLLVTSSSGALRALDTSGGGGGYSVSPLPLMAGYSVRCDSGVAIFSPPPVDATTTPSLNSTGSIATGRSSGEGGEGGYYVYAIVDVPPEGIGMPATSRVIAYNHPRSSNSPRWISPSILGAVSGTPAISSDGKYVYLTHNTNTSGTLRGYFSVLSDAEEGKVMWTTSSTDVGTPDGWGPVGIVHSPVEGNYLGGRLNDMDVAAWGHLSGDGDGGYFEGKYVHGFQMPVGYDPAASSASDLLEAMTFQETNWSTTSAPAMGKDGYTMIFSASESRLGGWTSGRRFDDSPNFAADMAKTNTTDAAAPPPYGPTLSPDGKTVYAGAVGPLVYAFETDGNGEELWQRDLGSPIGGRVVPSPDGTRVNVVESMSGTLHGLDAADGSILWTRTPQGGAKEALSDFCVSSDGTTLYRGLADGTIEALQLGTAVTPPPVPSASPTAPSPTVVAPSAPTLSPRPTASPRPTNWWEAQPSAPSPGATPRPTNWWDKEEFRPPSPPSPPSPTVSPAPTVTKPTGRPTYYWERTNPPAPTASSTTSPKPTGPTVSPRPTGTPQPPQVGPPTAPGADQRSSARRQGGVPVGSVSKMAALATAVFAGWWVILC